VQPQPLQPQKSSLQQKQPGSQQGQQPSVAALLFEAGQASQQPSTQRQKPSLQQKQPGSQQGQQPPSEAEVKAL
jgi:hypothetical protein